MMMASLRASWQQLMALVISRWCSFWTAMLQWISIFIYSPQCRFSSSRFINPSSLHSFSLLSTSLSIFSTNILAFRISSSAFSCFFISLRMAALLRQVGTMSYFSSSLKSLMRVSSRSMAQLTAFSAIMKCLFFLRMQARLLKVRILSLARVAGSVRCLLACGSMTMSTALEMNLMLPPSSSSLMFSIASLFTFWMNRPISSARLNSTFTASRYNSIRARWISFYSQRMHSMELLSSRSLNLQTTAQMQCRICSLLMLLSSISSTLLGASIEIMLLYVLWEGGVSKISRACSCMARRGVACLRG